MSVVGIVGRCSGTIYTVLKLSGRILQVKVAVKNILLLRWKQRAHTLLVFGGEGGGNPKGTLEPLRVQFSLEKA